MSQVKKYWVKSNYKFNLSSMREAVWCCIYDIEEGKQNTVNLMGENMDIDALYDFKEEVEDLLGKALSGPVSGKDYGRIKAISDARNIMRYATCLATGMSEREAGYAFFD